MADTNHQIENTFREAKALQNDIKEYKSYNTGEAFDKNKKLIKRHQRQVYMIHCVNLYFRIAAILLLPLVVSSLILGYLYFRPLHSNTISWVEVSSAPGLVSHFQLPDGSNIWLNSGSKLKYPSRFDGDSREVKLVGEGYFEVHSDQVHPFYVGLYNGMKVMAHGTKFNITSYPSDSIIETSLFKGHIDMIHGDSHLQIQPLQKVTYNKKDGKFYLAAVNADASIHWKSGMVVFRNSSLEEVARKLSLRYNVKINVKNNSGTDYRIRANFTYENVSQILSYLQMAIPMKWNLVMDKTNHTNNMNEKCQYNVWLN